MLFYLCHEYEQEMIVILILRNKDSKGNPMITGK